MEKVFRKENVLLKLCITHQRVLVDVTFGGKHGLHHKLVTILLVGVELEGLQAHWRERQVKLLTRDGCCTTLTCYWWLEESPEIWTVCLASMTPELGLTQYRFGAVVLILKQTLRSDGLVRRIDDETWLVNGPERRFGKTKF